MEDFLFATFLFLVYFCFMCCLLHSPASANATTVTKNSGEVKVSEAEPNVEKPVQFIGLQEVVLDEEKPDALELIEQELVSTPRLDELLEGIDLESLQVRPARKIAKALGIKQTVTKGKKKADKPLDWLRREIKQKLQQNPQEVALVIKEVLAA